MIQKELTGCLIKALEGSREQSLKKGLTGRDHFIIITFKNWRRGADYGKSGT
jgi:hypothetical protein